MCDNRQQDIMEADAVACSNAAIQKQDG